MVDVPRSAHPLFAGCVAADGYTHETQCVIYPGPDATYAGHEICFSSNDDTLTHRRRHRQGGAACSSRAPATSGRGYTHQGWLTDDQRYFLMDDELDEQNFGHNTRTRIWDVRDLDAPYVSAPTTAPRRRSTTTSTSAATTRSRPTTAPACASSISPASPAALAERGRPLRHLPGQRRRRLQRRVEQLSVLRQRHRAGRAASRGPVRRRRRHRLRHRARRRRRRRVPPTTTRSRDAHRASARIPVRRSSAADRGAARWSAACALAGSGFTAGLGGDAVRRRGRRGAELRAVGAGHWRPQRSASRCRSAFRSATVSSAPWWSTPTRDRRSRTRTANY